MPIKELFNQINNMRLRQNLPVITEEQFITEISFLQIIDKITIIGEQIFINSL